MLALVFYDRLRVRRAHPVPVPDVGEALIRVRLGGICSTDIEITRGYKHFHGVLGHEFVGTVAESPDSSWIGARVCGEINLACGDCRFCRAGLRTHCEVRTVLGIIRRNGAFADYVTLPLQNLHAVPPEVTDEEAVFAEPLAAAFQILEQVHVETNMTAAVVGDGKLGLLCVQVLAGTGAQVVLYGHHEANLALAAKWGIAASMSRDASVDRFDVVVEATGSPGGLDFAIGLVRPRGTIVMKSTLAKPVRADLSPLVVKEVTLIGSRCGPFQRAIAALAERSIDVKDLIADRYSLGDGVEAFERAERPGVLKVLIDAS